MRTVHGALVCMMIFSSTGLAQPVIRIPSDMVTDSYISRDGQSLTGRIGSQNVILSRSQGIQPLSITGASDSSLEEPQWYRGVSNDRQVFVGIGETDQSRDSDEEVLRWEDKLQWHTLTASDSEFGAISEDGSVVVGNFFEDDAEDDQTYAFHWSVDDRLQRIPFILVPDATRYRGEATDVSADGRIVVGYSTGRIGGANPRAPIEAFLWTAETETVGLGALKPDHNSFATAISGDGKFIVGYSECESDGQAFIRDEANGMVGLPGTDPQYSRAFFVTNDGQFIFGDSRNELVVWDENREVHELGQFLRRAGVDIDAWTDLSVLDVSDEGTILLGVRIEREQRTIVITLGLDACDLTADGKCNAGDIDRLTDAVIQGNNNPFLDVTWDQVVDQSDRTFWIENLMNSYVGDANLDREFSSGDLVHVFQAGHYEDGIAMNSGWAEGDWDGDGDFTSADLVVAFRGGGYEQGLRGKANEVPGPNGLSMMMIALALAAGSSKGRQRRRATFLRNDVMPDGNP